MRAKAGDRRSGVDRQQPAQFGSRLVEAAEMYIGYDFGAARGVNTRLVVQGTICPLDRFFEVAREKMSG